MDEITTDSHLKYTLGFVFNSDCTRVLLVHKQRPEWQKGRANGIGGKLDQGESPEACISRETLEESRLSIPAESWRSLGLIRQAAGDVAVFYTQYNGSLADAKRGDHEEVEWFSVAQLPSNVMDNLRWMIPLALDAMRSKNPFRFTVQYD